MSQNNLQARLLKLQAKPLSVPKDGQAAIQGRVYKYMTLDALLGEAVPALNAAGLTLVQRLDIADGSQVLVTSIGCPETGETLNSVALLPVHDVTAHQYGSWLTYLKRYQIAALLAVADLDDDDAHAALPPQRQQAPPPQQQRQYEQRRDDRYDDQHDDDLGSCRDCGAPNKLSKAGKKYCGAMCWKAAPLAGNGRH